MKVLTTMVEQCVGVERERERESTCVLFKRGECLFKRVCECVFVCSFTVFNLFLCMCAC